MASIYFLCRVGLVNHFHRFIWALTASLSLVFAASGLAFAASANGSNGNQTGAKPKVLKISHQGKRKTYAKRPAARIVRPARPSDGMRAGLHGVADPLSLRSSVAYVIDQETQEVLLSKNEEAVLPIASLTKLMTGLLISEAELSLDEMITITQDDVDTEKGSTSRLRVGSTLSRGELMHLALMSSENRAAHALGRTYPGGLQVFVEMMNAKAQLLGMQDTQYVEPTGLSSKNRSSARDLAVLVNVASDDSLLREYSTSPAYQVAVGRRKLVFSNTNRLVRNPTWEIGLQKTGYISEAGQCLVMQAKVAGRNLIMVFLDSAGKLSRLGDAERVRRWVESIPAKAPGPMTENLIDAPAPVRLISVSS
ncbi:D-alanyl-D-alanine endopeptidase [Curvibacter fontanus]|jgi:D-alanyl-D-alanine endopeptidase (penicillin-binding protein 7)